MEAYIQVMVKSKRSSYRTIRFMNPVSAKGEKNSDIATIKLHATDAINAAYFKFRYKVADYSVCLVRKDGSVIEFPDGHTACLTQRNLNLFQHDSVIRELHDPKIERKLNPYWVMEFACFPNPD